jgi:hypothetical protein
MPNTGASNSSASNPAPAADTPDLDAPVRLLQELRDKAIRLVLGGVGPLSKLGVRVFGELPAKSARIMARYVHPDKNGQSNESNEAFKALKVAENASESISDADVGAFQQMLAMPKVRIAKQDIRTYTQHTHTANIFDIVCDHFWHP